MSSYFRCLIIGESTLPLECSRFLHQQGHTIAGIVTSEPALKEWAQQNGIPTVPPSDNMAVFAEGLTFDYLFSIVNLRILPAALVRQARVAALNFHDGPLPHYAGLHATSWAILNGER